VAQTETPGHIVEWTGVAMIGRITIKRALKRTAGWAAVLAAPFAGPPARSRACIFVYHRVAAVGFVDGRVDDWNVPPALFERQIASLARFAEFVALSDLPHKLKGYPPHPKPLVCLTFDDGYANFHSRVLPILKRYQAPASVFVVTDLIGQQDPIPFDSWSRRHRNRVGPEAWRSMDWPELEACVGSGLVTVGAHSHRHLKGGECTQAQLAEEVGASREILARRLGEAQSRAYAYPYGSTRLGYVPPGYVHAVRAAGYQLAVTTDLGLADGDGDPYLLPRVEAHAVDGPCVLAAKARGVLGPFYVTDRLRTAKRAV